MLRMVPFPCFVLTGVCTVFIGIKIVIPHVFRVGSGAVTTVPNNEPNAPQRYFLDIDKKHVLANDDDGARIGVVEARKRTACNLCIVARPELGESIVSLGLTYANNEVPDPSSIDYPPCRPGRSNLEISSHTSGAGLAVRHQSHQATSTGGRFLAGSLERKESMPIIVNEIVNDYPIHQHIQTKSFSLRGSSDTRQITAAPVDGRLSVPGGSRSAEIWTLMLA